MNSQENVEKFVRDKKPRVTTGREMDKQVLDDSFAAMEKTLLAQSKTRGPRSRNFILQSRIMRFAAAAVIILATGLLLTRDRQRPNGSSPEPEFVAQSPTQKVSMMSLRTTYEQGGWDALDRQFRDTLNTLGPRPSSLTMGQLLNGTNGL
jgi:hypothetical protein